MPTKIIAEFCQNHMGDLSILGDMVQRAGAAGADFGKIQTFFADDLSEHWRGNGEYERMKALEVDWIGHETFAKECRQNGLIPMTSVYKIDYAPQLRECGIEWIKIGSAQAQDLGLIRFYKEAGFNVICSTGGHNLDTFQFVKPIEGYLHCVSKYPSEWRDQNFQRMFTLKTRYPDGWGLSSHCPDTKPSKFAIWCGADYVEQHVTLPHIYHAKDYQVSISPLQLQDLINYRNTPLPLQSWWKAFSGSQDDSEIDLIKKYKSRWT